jgi:hypothetical protein
MTTLPMIFVHPDELPIIGKFDEKLDLEKALKPIKMYMEDEEIIEEPLDNEEIKKDSEYYKRKRQRRKQFRTQSQLIIEDSTPRVSAGPPRGVRYEGRLTNLNLMESSSGSTSFQVKPKAKSITDAPFKFVILQPQKLLINGKEKTQILVTPVGGNISLNYP